MRLPSPVVRLGWSVELIPAESDEFVTFTGLSAFSSQLSLQPLSRENSPKCTIKEVLCA